MSTTLTETLQRPAAEGVPEIVPPGRGVTPGAARRRRRSTGTVTRHPWR